MNGPLKAILVRIQRRVVERASVFLGNTYQVRHRMLAKIGMVTLLSSFYEARKKKKRKKNRDGKGHSDVV